MRILFVCLCENGNCVHLKSAVIRLETSPPYVFFAVGVEMGDWQEVWDENSGCYYYWNTLTNEVSWELPHYLADQVQSLGQYTNR